MVSWFIFVQHGSHGQLKDFDPLSEAIQQRFASSGSSSQHRIKIFGSKVNERTETDRGTMKCVDKIMPELERALVDFCCAGTDINSHQQQNQHHTCYFSCASHSFGGILTREVVKRLFTQYNVPKRDDGDDDDDDKQSATEGVSIRLSLPNNNKNGNVTINLTPLQFVSVASPHCGVNSIEYSLLRWGGRLLGKVYSNTYHELFLDSPLLERMAGLKSSNVGACVEADPEGSNKGSRISDTESSSPYLKSFTSFQDHLFVAAQSHDYLVRFETATLLPVSDLQQQQRTQKSTNNSGQAERQQCAFPKRMMRKAGSAESAESAPSTHVGKTIDVYPEPTTSPTTSKFTQLEQESKPGKGGLDIAMALRSALFSMKKPFAGPAFRVVPVFIPSETQQPQPQPLPPSTSATQVTDSPASSSSSSTKCSSFSAFVRSLTPAPIAQWISPRSFCIAHDALIRKGISADVLPDVVDAVAAEMIDVFFASVTVRGRCLN